LAKELASTNAHLRQLVSRSAPERIKAGDVVTVATCAPATGKPLGAIKGVVLEVRRRGIDSSLLIRNMVQQQLGVEWRVKVFAPTTSSIDVLQRGEGYRRNRVFYLRKQPGRVFQRL